MAPFIELGVGFNPELTARENGVLNGVLMGLTLREARRSLDEVLEFAELEDFVDLKLKNYSSGMMVRFAFAVMVQADADIMLIDEVLAVGDAAFAQKCMDVFREQRRAGKTIVLVTHDMTTVQTLCHRAMLLHDGELRYLGEPEDAALRYYRMNFAANVGRRPGAGEPGRRRQRARRPRSCRRGGRAVENARAGRPDRARRVARGGARSRPADLHLPRPQRRRRWSSSGSRARSDERVAPGRRVRLAGTVENPLVAGRYSLDVYIREEAEQGGLTVQGLRLLHFVVYGTAPPHGIVSVQARRRAGARVSRAGGATAPCATFPARRRSAAAGGGRSSCST